MKSLCSCVLLLALSIQLGRAASFQISPQRALIQRYSLVTMSAGEEEPSPVVGTKLSLEEKMKKWEATEEEIKAATLGGVGIPKANGERTGAFDIGLYVAFPFMIIGSLMFALFPFVMDKIDVSSVGPPPTV
jgi:hypothetical protein